MVSRSATYHGIWVVALAVCHLHASPSCAAQVPEAELRQRYESAQQAFRQNHLAEAQTLFEQVLGQSYEQLGGLYRRVGRYSEAVADLEEAQKLEPQNRDAERELGLAYLGNRQYAAAVKSLEGAISAGMANAETLAALGQAYMSFGDLADARLQLERAVKADPSDHFNAYQLATVLLAMKDADGAARLFSELKREVGDSARFHLLVGRAYASAGYYAQGDAELRRALALDPKIHYAHHLLGMSVLERAGGSHLDEAQREFEAEVRFHPDEFPPLFMLGVLMETKRQWAQALAYLHRAQRLQPQDAEVDLQLGAVELLAGKSAQAIQDLQRAVDRSQEGSSGDVARRAHDLLGRANRALGDLNRAEAEAEEAQRLSAADSSHQKEALDRDNLVQRSLQKMAEAEQEIIWQQLRPPLKEDADVLSLERMYLQVLANAHNGLGLIAARRDQLEEAVRQFEKVVALDRDFPRANYNLGLAAFRAQRLPEAIAALKRATAMSPDDQAAVTLLGLAEFQYEDFAEAVPNLAKAEPWHPDAPGLLLALGTCLVHEKRTEEAQKIFDRLLRTNADRPEVHMLLGQAAFAEGKNKAAGAELRNALALDPHASEAHYYLGMIDLNDGQLPAAEAEFRAEVEGHPDNAKARYNLAYVLLREQKSEKGIRLLEELVKDVPGYAEAHYSLGKALLEAGDVPRATAELKTAVRLDPSKAFSHYQLGRAYLKAGNHLAAQKEWAEVDRLNAATRLRQAQRLSEQ